MAKGRGGPGYRDPSDKEPAETLTAFIGRTVKARRLASGMTQQELTERLRLDGLPWHRSAIAAVEAGERELSATELIIVADILGIPVAALLGAGPGRTMLAIGPVVRATPDLLSRRMTADPSKVPWSSLFVDRGAQMAALARILEELPDDSLAKLWKPTAEEALLAAGESSHEAVVKAAKLLNRLPFDISLASVMVWGRGFVEEREARFRVRPDCEDLPARSRQAVRGRITRDLIAELSERLPKLDEGAR